MYACVHIFLCVRSHIWIKEDRQYLALYLQASVCVSNSASADASEVLAIRALTAIYQNGHVTLTHAPPSSQAPPRTGKAGGGRETFMYGVSSPLRPAHLNPVLLWTIQQ